MPACERWAADTGCSPEKASKEIIPKIVRPGTQAKVVRKWIEGLPPRTLSLLLPNQVMVAYDSASGQVLKAWKSALVNQTPSLDSRSQNQVYGQGAGNCRGRWYRSWKGMNLIFYTTKRREIPCSFPHWLMGSVKTSLSLPRAQIPSPCLYTRTPFPFLMKTILPSLTFLLFTSLVLCSNPCNGYKVVTVPLPRGAVSVLGLCHKPDGTLAIATWEGEVWESKDAKCGPSLPRI